MSSSSSDKKIIKQVDKRITTLIVNGIRLKHRTIFMAIGDHPEDQVAKIYDIFKRNAHGGLRPILWAYKDTQLIKKTKKAQLAKDQNLEAFVQQANINFCYYADTHRILGNTFSMCILQDFEGLTPNLLARTIETVEGGGIVMLLIKKLTEVKQLYTLTMDVHNRYRTSKHKYVKPRFNERMLLSLSKCESFLAVNDELQGLDLSTTTTEVELVEVGKYDTLRTESEKQLKQVQESLKENEIAGPLVKLAKTCDQAKVITELVQTILGEDASRKVSTVTAARGRGKSAALGIAVASAVFQGYSMIFCTSPSPENLNTFFQFVVKGLEALDYNRQDHFEIIQSTNQLYNKAVVRINIYKDHKQTIQFVSADDSSLFNQAELVVIDEAAAIPLPLVSKMFGSHLTIMASTVNGYEGTGRSLSLKLISTLKNKQKGSDLLQELQLQEPIRYAPGDKVEVWLNQLLCLDCNTVTPCLQCPAPTACDLYYVNRDTLFSFNPSAEVFLQQMVSLYVASHYRNQPNDIQLMSDAPAHHLFVLCGPVSVSDKKLPKIFAAIQVCEEGEIPSSDLADSLNKGKRPSGDMIPYSVGQAFQNSTFGQLSGIRIVRIAVDPDFQKCGYGTRAMQLLLQYYNGDIVFEGDDDMDESAPAGNETQEVLEGHLLTPLTRQRLQYKPHWIGTSFGVTQLLFKFWNRLDFCPIYMRHARNDLTGEHTMIMIKEISADASAAVLGQSWLAEFHNDFNQRLVHLFGSVFRDIPTDLAMSLMLESSQEGSSPLRPPFRATKVRNDIKNQYDEITVCGNIQVNRRHLEFCGFTQSDLKRLSACARQATDLETVMDLVPKLANLYFAKQFAFGPDGSEGVRLEIIETCVFLSVGLQRHSLNELQQQQILGGIGAGQMKSQLLQVMRKLNTFLQKVFEMDTTKTADVDITPATEETHDFTTTTTTNDNGKRTQDPIAANESKKKVKKIVKKKK